MNQCTFMQEKGGGTPRPKTEEWSGGAIMIYYSLSKKKSKHHSYN